MGSVTHSFLRFFRGGSAPQPSKPAEVPGAATRRSSGLAELVRGLQNREGLSVLDLGSTSPTNIGYFTNLGHRLYNEDVVSASVNPDFRQKTHDGLERIDPEPFLRENLVYSGVKFDVVLCWDIADYLAEELVKPTIERLHFIMNPGGILLAFFHTRDAGPHAPYYRYHIGNPETLRLQPGPPFKVQRVFNNRHVENLFRDYTSLKFFLSRDNLREVLVVR